MGRSKALANCSNEHPANGVPKADAQIIYSNFTKIKVEILKSDFVPIHLQAPGPSGNYADVMVLSNTIPHTKKIIKP